jgi:hypothetical protein
MRAVCLFVGAALAAACALGQERDYWYTEAARAELRRLEGAWDLAWVESGGEKVAAKAPRGSAAACW